MQYHTNTYGPDETGFTNGLQKALAEAHSSGTNELLILTHTLSNLEGVMLSVLGEPFMKSFKKNRVASAGDTKVYLETEKIKSSFSKGVIFAPFVSLKLLEKATLDYRASDVVYVPWAEPELNDYIQSTPTSIQI